MHPDAVQFAARATGPYALVLVDPPYASDLAVRAVSALPEGTPTSARKVCVRT